MTEKSAGMVHSSADVVIENDFPNWRSARECDAVVYSEFNRCLSSAGTCVA